MDASEADRAQDQGQHRPTIIVLDAVETAMRNAEIEVKIVKDVGKGPDGDVAAPVFLDMPPTVYESGSVPIRTTFGEPGRFIGLVTARFPGTAAEPYVTRFPFAVGGTGIIDYYTVLEIAALLSGAGAVIYSIRRGLAAKNAAST
jgi:hypothetical protein